MQDPEHRGTCYEIQSMLLDDDANSLHARCLLMRSPAEFTQLHDLHDRQRCLHNLCKLRQCGQQGPAYDAR